KYEPQNPTAHIELARFWKDKGILESAVKEAKLAIQYEKNLENSMGHYNELGLIYHKFRLLPDAEESFLKAKDINPGNTAVMYNLASVYTEKEDYTKVRQTYETLLKINPREYTAMEKLGYAWIKLQDKTKAREVLENLLKEKPDYPNRAEIQKTLSAL
ncbi:MAG TPA: hypothetical protein DC049_16320, partial [Spirochaetia bacterium]|nr:hypothetical protein [Spirochaetia bacterium]